MEYPSATISIKTTSGAVAARDDECSASTIMPSIWTRAYQVDAQPSASSHRTAHPPTVGAEGPPAASPQRCTSRPHVAAKEAVVCRRSLAANTPSGRTVFPQPLAFAARLLSVALLQPRDGRQHALREVSAHREQK